MNPRAYDYTMDPISIHAIRMGDKLLHFDDFSPHKLI